MMKICDVLNMIPSKDRVTLKFKVDLIEGTCAAIGFMLNTGILSDLWVNSVRNGYNSIVLEVERVNGEEEDGNAED